MTEKESFPGNLLSEKAGRSAETTILSAIRAGPDECWHAWFDGAALPNPGRIGLGAVLVAPDGRRFEGSRLAGLEGCNNEAELRALMEVLELARTAGAKQLVVSGDSDFAVRHVQGFATTAVGRLSVLLAEVQAMLANFDAVRFVWVPRHRNGHADRLSRQALGLPPKAPVKKIRRRRR